MRMQAELCGLVVRDPSLSVTQVGDWPGKAPKRSSKGRLHS